MAKLNFEVSDEFFPVGDPPEEHKWQPPEYVLIRIPIILVESPSQDYYGEWDHNGLYDLDFANLSLEDGEAVYGDVEDLPEQWSDVVGNDETQKLIYKALTDPERFSS